MARIGIPANVVDDELIVKTELLSYVSGYGHVPVVLTPGDESSINFVDGLVLSGGPDVDSRRYSTGYSFFSGRPSPALEWFDSILLQKAIGKMPIFGICRGFQSLNVVFGGTLQQHLPSHPQSMSDSDLCHDVLVIGTRKRVGVNSFHHQGIKQLGKGLTPVAEFEPTRMVEAFISTSNELPKVGGVQWHPERYLDSISDSIFKTIFS